MDSGESGQCESCGKNVYNFRRICVSCAQLTTLIREVAASRSVPTNVKGGAYYPYCPDRGASPCDCPQCKWAEKVTERAKAVNMHPDLQACIAREMEKKD